VSVDKARLIQVIEEHLKEELAELGDSDPGRAQEIERQLLMYRFLPKRAYGADDVVVPSALVELVTGLMRAWYLVVPQGGAS
jgi:hypothetical protein